MALEAREELCPPGTLPVPAGLDQDSSCAPCKLHCESSSRGMPEPLGQGKLLPLARIPPQHPDGLVAVMLS